MESSHFYHQYIIFKEKKLIQKKKELVKEDFESSSDEMDIEEEEIRYDQNIKHKKSNVKKTKNIEEEDEWSSESNEEIQAEFEFHDPAPEQFHSVRTLINGLIDGENYLSSELADLICQQPEVGTTIGINNGEEEKTSKDVEVIALSTILNLRVNKVSFKLVHYYLKEVNAVKQILKYVVTKVKKNCQEREEDLNTMFSTKEVGLFINERLII